MAIFYYRLYFIALFLLLGVSCAGIVVLDYFAGITMIKTDTALDRQALIATLYIMSVLGFFTAFIIVFLLREKRNAATDQRQLNRPLDFIDRRSNTDRRST